MTRSIKSSRAFRLFKPTGWFRMSVTHVVAGTFNTKSPERAEQMINMLPRGAITGFRIQCRPVV